MTPHQIQLQLSQVGALDAHVRQLAEAGIDTVDRASLGDDLFDHLPRSFHALTRIRRERHLLAARRNVGDLLNRQRLTVEMKHRNARSEERRVGKELRWGLLEELYMK